MASAQSRKSSICDVNLKADIDSGITEALKVGCCL